ncbi:glutamate dehydrogenase [Altererythrobacter atlanticus]|uniref:NAD-specific glutamate dehydrogenase n=1 Tax=Croceibacterium atlanticum TaxID=1267766 RepID=A0A0F7KVG8_9SPHN|nr:NAD-glutamate dehydrogenase domain-containing protein [Croceibacterium atlanticum]AKH43171.1 NAD-specific glutamate dehydrogenase [Croceibacterium atlanticum]MBB5732124.1 glutamate dehydrogenase [Croceibacterium atlanticum]
MAAAKRKGGTATKGMPAGKEDLAAELRTRIAESRLPGEKPLSEDQLDDVTAFLLQAAMQRKEGEGTVTIRTGTGSRRVTRIAMINKDMPFLIDSIGASIAAQGLSIDLLVHPVLPVRRTAEGEVETLPIGESAGEKRESWVYLETERVDAKERQALERDLGATMGDVRAAVADWPKMVALMQEDADRTADAEGAALLRWLAEGRLTQLGHLTRKRDGRHSQALGLCRRGLRDLLADDTYDRAFAWFDDGRGRAPLIVKANRISRVHRRVPLDLFIVPVVEKGRVEALSIHAGTWTSAALSTPPAEIPVLRGQLANISKQLGFEKSSHGGKTLLHALTVLPHDLVIGFSEDDILRVATTMMALADRPRPRLAVVTAPLQRHLFAFVWLPRDMISTGTRHRIMDLLKEETGATTLDWSLLVEGGNLAMLRFVLDYRGIDSEIDEETMDARLQQMLRGWTDAVEDALAEREEPGRAAALASHYADAFPPSYRDLYGPAEAARDIERVRHLDADDPLRPLRRDTRLYRLESDSADNLRLKIYQQGGSMPLSDAVPALENFGFRVLAELPTQLGGTDTGTIHDFQLGLPRGDHAAQLLARSEEIEHAICAVLNGKAENDVFNRLVTGTGLDAQETDWLRAFYRYLRQANIAFTIYTVVDALRGAPNITRALIELFRVRHDPAFKGDREEASAAANEAIRNGLSEVAAINDDRLLRLYWATIQAILRTNAFTEAAQEALAFKIDSPQVPGLPKPVPWREIWVYSRRVEGIHLRAGPVARGGIRWSDRRDDFRTEILGLMKAQRVKNAVIVPTGAKGGFYPKRLPDPTRDRDAWAAEGKESYKLYIRSLLSVTDNIEGDKVVHPQGVVIHDGNDPYFVVAADKGTARFSDTANEIAEERGFWLGDAFASGGSHGYDHKAMGITARGAWISVQRHFLEMGVDVQTESVRVAGCGDMSGDVFGNGMLLSRAIKLVFAFDHRHIFIDPDPDPETSWAERKRMFDLPRSSWADYSEKLISRGGGVFPRSMKRIPLSPEAREALGVEAEELDPESLISAILKSEVDLIWFGGIGTYIRAGTETDAQVGDPANDGLRVSGREVRAKVVGEGANLGVTQAGRIEFALKGGRINTDFIDNSAGVDCSDNEVNIKIGLSIAQRSGKLSQKRRNALLVEMTDEVAELVLEDNRLQALALSIAQAGGANAVPSQTRLIETLEDIGNLDRRTEGLADDEALARRAADGTGLTRPELAVLLSNAKLVLQDAIEESDLSADKAAEPLLLADFPPHMAEDFRKQLLAHRLRNEIVATSIANRIVNRMGLLHPFELAEEEGAGLDHVAAAFVGACELLGMGPIWTAIDEAEIPEAARLMLFEQAALALRGHMADLLRAGGATLAPSKVIGELSASVAQLITRVDELLAVEAREHSEAIAATLIDAGAPGDLANRVAILFALDGAIGLSRLSLQSGVAAVDLANAFIDLGEQLGLDWAQAKAAVMNPSDPWERLLVAGLARDFQQMRFDFLRNMTVGARDKADPQMRIGQWLETHASAIRQLRAMIGRAQSANPVAPAMLAQIASQARNLLQR